MQKQLIVALFAIAGGISGSLQANDCCESCGAQCGKHRLVARTVMVPKTVIETQVKSCLIYKTETREETYTVFKRVPDERKIYKEVCYLDDEVKSKEITETNCKLVEIPVTKECKTKVPVSEFQQGVRLKECCDQCGNKICVEEPCCCEVVREVDGIKSECVEEIQVVFEKTKRTIDYCVKTPKKSKELVCEETAYKLVPVEKTRTVEVQVPEYVKQPCEVKVRKMVPQTIYCCEKCCDNHHHNHASNHAHHHSGNDLESPKLPFKLGLLDKASKLLKH